MRKCVLGDFAGERLCRSLFFNRVAGIRPVTLFVGGLWHGCFPVGFAKFLGAPFVAEHLRTTASVY